MSIEIVNKTKQAMEEAYQNREHEALQHVTELLQEYQILLQNRLEHTIANLDNISENTQSAESRIRDTDMAEEMVNYSKNNILEIGRAHV